MDDLSVLRGPKRPLPSPGLLHDYFHQAAQDNSDRAATMGVYSQGTFCSYGDINARASRAVDALRMRLAMLRRPESRTGRVFNYDFVTRCTCNVNGSDGVYSSGRFSRRSEPSHSDRQRAYGTIHTRVTCGSDPSCSGSHVRSQWYLGRSRDGSTDLQPFGNAMAQFSSENHSPCQSPPSSPLPLPPSDPLDATLIHSSSAPTQTLSTLVSSPPITSYVLPQKHSSSYCPVHHPSPSPASLLLRVHSDTSESGSSPPRSPGSSPRPLPFELSPGPRTPELPSVGSSPCPRLPESLSARSPDPSPRPRPPVIAVDIQPSADLLVVLLAVMRLGAAYLPVDSQSAINRVRYILNEARPLCVVADSQSAFLADTRTVWSGYDVIDCRELLDWTPGDVTSSPGNLNVQIDSISGELTSEVTSEATTDRPSNVLNYEESGCDVLYTPASQDEPGNGDEAGNGLHGNDPWTAGERVRSTPAFDNSTDNVFLENSEETSEGQVDSAQYGDGTLLAVIYTSGSAGTPKGVRVTHRSAMNRLSWQWDAFPFTATSVGCFKTSLLFVDSIVEIFSCALHLVPMVIAPRGLTSNPESFVALLEEYHVTRLVMVPSLLRSLLFYLSISGGKSRLPALSHWVCNSETLLPSLLHRFFDTFPSGKLFSNYYGSTETMADVTYEVFTCPEDVKVKTKDNIISIGRPIYNCCVYIVGEQRHLVARGEVGEICISGLNVADRYLDDERSEAFIPNPFPSDPDRSDPDHGVLYRSGDFGRMVEHPSDGLVIIYEGRRDLQVKIRGQRVNITEIERVVQEVEAVERAMVLFHKFSPISEVIVAYYSTSFWNTKKTEGDGINGKIRAATEHAMENGEREGVTARHSRRTRIESEITQACRRSLPNYMRPKLLHLEDFPLQPHTGKIDRVALRRLYEKAFNRQSSQELATLDKKSQKAMNVIALNLNLPTRGVPKRNSFFELGGTSVTMMSTIVQLRQNGLHVPIEVFSSARNIQELIDHVAESSDPIGEILRTDKYVVMPMHEVLNNEEIVEVLTDSFVEKEPLDVLLGVTREEFSTFALSLYQEAARGQLSLIVLDKDTHRIVGGDFLFDYFQGVCVEHHETMSPILTLFQEFEEPIKSRLRTEHPGPLLLNFCLCVHKDLPHADQVKICHLIEGHVIQVARDNRFVGVVTNNTNPVTQDICQYFYEYECLSSLLVREFIYNKRKVFAHAPEDYYIKMMIKYINLDSS